MMGFNIRMGHDQLSRYWTIDCLLSLALFANDLLTSIYKTATKSLLQYYKYVDTLKKFA
jgi:hypothetical protein